MGSGLRSAVLSSKVACESSRNNRVVDEGGLEKYVDGGGVSRFGECDCMHSSDSGEVSAISSPASLKRFCLRSMGV